MVVICAGKLNETHLQAVWSSTLDKHVSVVGKLYTLIVSLVLYLPRGEELY